MHHSFKRKLTVLNMFFHSFRQESDITMKVSEIIKSWIKLHRPAMPLTGIIGLLVGRSDRDVNCIYIALDATEQAIEEAFSFLARSFLWLTIRWSFRRWKRLMIWIFIGKRILTLIENHMVYFAMHTNFDVSAMGALAADRLGLTETSVLEVTVPQTLWEVKGPLALAAGAASPKQWH